MTHLDACLSSLTPGLARLATHLVAAPKCADFLAIAQDQGLLADLQVFLAQLAGDAENAELMLCRLASKASGGPRAALAWSMVCQGWR